MNRPMIRVASFIVVFVLVIVLPWWVSAVVLMALTIYFPFYLEILFFGFLFDTLYSAHYTFPFTALTFTVVFLITVMFIRSRIRV
ncbi:MAG: hypothetical protein HY507_01855 [Candidatus Zambryskibacteria bacterium]|nr:hypothetical protein [Candidatus Zambryskibacteria bacterium]